MTDVSAYFTLPPDWSDGLTLIRSWKTSVITNQNGGEQRSSLHTWPRRSMRLSFANLDWRQTAYCWRMLWAHIHQVLGLPMWMHAAVLSAEAASGQKIVNVDSTENRDWEAGLDAIMVRPWDMDFAYEVGTIASMTAASLTMEDNLSITWPAGTLVCPVLAARIDPSQTVRASTDRAGDLSFEATEAYE
ncbi:MAG: hypothetical protein KKB20_08095 [Proteobacteria bacterium]|nr:hypothetical protein [Pseudomonadota bacterium]